MTRPVPHAITGHRRYAYYHLVAETGLRCGEAAMLRETDVDLDRNELFVTPRPDPGDRATGDDGSLKSRGSTRTIAVDHVTASVLRRHIAAHTDTPAANDGQRYLFTTPTGAPCRIDLFTHEFTHLLTARTNLPPIRLHDLRHGAASLSLAAGNDLKSVQDMLGHASMSFTADTYVSLYPSRRHQAAERTGASLFTAPASQTHRTQLPLRCRHLAGHTNPTRHRSHAPKP